MDYKAIMEIMEQEQENQPMQKRYRKMLFTLVT